jgi:hypothetical protein
MGGPEIAKDGKKFFVDMTDASGGGGEAYLGLDFGTSNTAVSYVDRNWVQLIESRSRDASWKEIGELVETLPVPLSIPLARYIGSHSQSSGVVPPSFSFIEASLCLAAYVSYCEFCTLPRRATSRLFKSFPHRSASSLWHLLKEVQTHIGKQGQISNPFGQLCQGPNALLFERITRNWAETRHELTVADQAEVLHAVRALANVSQQVFSNYSFGYFEEVHKQSFSSRYSGRFRIAHGKPPHTSSFEYSGLESFSTAEAMLLNIHGGDALRLMPLVLWYPCTNHRDMDRENGHCYFFDKLRGEGNEAIATFKATGFPCQLQFGGSDPEAAELISQLVQLKSEDPEVAGVGPLKLVTY